MLFINIRCSTVELMLRYPAPFMGSLIPLNFINYLCRFYTSHTWRWPIEPSGHHVDCWGGPPQKRKLTFPRFGIWTPKAYPKHWTSGGIWMSRVWHFHLFFHLSYPVVFFSERSGDFCFVHGGCWIRYGYGSDNHQPSAIRRDITTPRWKVKVYQNGMPQKNPNAKILAPPRRIE